MTEQTDDFATRPDAIPELMALADKCGPHAVAVLIALDRWQAAIIDKAEQVTTNRILKMLEAFDVSCPTATIEYRCGYEVARDRIEAAIERLMGTES